MALTMALRDGHTITSSTVRHLRQYGTFICGTLAWFFIASGCASIPVESNVVALVDGEPITKEDVEYAIEIAHRRENLSVTKNINISEFVQALIDEMLIIQEAKRMGLQNDPLITGKVFAYHLREAVTKLYNEEIVQKVEVSESDIDEYYKENYEIFRFGFIETDDEDRAERALELIRKGADFSDVAREYSVHASRENGGLVMLERRALSPELDPAVTSLKPGEVSPVTRSGSKYYIVQLIDRSKAGIEGLDKVKSGITRTINNIKAKQLGEDYIEFLHKKYPPDINQKLLVSMNLPMTAEERTQWLEDERELVRVGDAVLTAGDFVRGFNPRSQTIELRDARIKQWIDMKLVDREALSRHYERDTSFQRKVDRYTNQLIKKEFIERFIKPQISATQDELHDYYNEHKDDFKRPARHRIHQITVKTIEEAEEILNSIANGADFSWLAKTRSVDRFGPKGGDSGWHETGELAAPIKGIIDSLQPGDTSPILEDGSLYRIIKLQDRIYETVVDFSTVKRPVTLRLFKAKHNKLYTSYIDKLKTDSHIEIRDDVIRSLRELFGQK